MKISSYLVAIGLVALTPFSQISTALAEGMYVTGSLGRTSIDDSKYKWTNPAFNANGKAKIGSATSLSLGVGMALTENIRGEVALSRSRGKLKNLSGTLSTPAGVFTGTLPASGNLKTTALMLNGYYDFMADQDFSPYITAGIGFAKHALKASALSGVLSTSGSDRVFAWQFGAGASYNLAENYSLFGDYRFMLSSDAKVRETKISYDAQEVRLGLRYHF